MARIVGMDIAQVLRTAEQFMRGAADLKRLVNDLTKEVETAHWKGPDRERFIQEWRGGYLVQLLIIAEDMHDAGVSAKTHANRQESASR